MDTNQDKPLWHYTMKEFLILQEQMITAQLERIWKKSTPVPEPEVDSITIQEACKLTGLKDKTIYSKVSRLEMPVLTRGRPLMFSNEELQLWMKLGKPTVAEMELWRRNNRI